MVDHPASQLIGERGPDGGPGRGRLRAAALPPGQRRAAIIASTVRLLIAHGTAITTRQIAEAACIAEGTIFRVFPDKDSLVVAAIEQAFDPAPVEDELQAIDATLPLATRLEQAVAILQSQFTDLWRLMTAVGMTRAPDDQPGASERRGTRTLRALAAVFEPDRDRLARDPLVAAQLLRGLIFAGSHPALLIGAPLPPAEIVAVLLDGIRIRPGLPC